MEKYNFYIYIIATLLIQSNVFCRQVTTKAGTFIGKDDEVSFKGVERGYTKFFGIPYGESTAGEGRFRRPKPKAYISEPFDATFMRPACPQMNFPGMEILDKDEDCLRLNIYVPKSDGNGPKGLPVMIWIHGGGFSTGSSHQYIGDVLSTYGNVIVVIINYRLSVFGFLSTNDETSRGNYGLWDQHLAIKWVNENIEPFGGDVKRITIFGESAGGVSVVFQALYPGNKGLFQRAIAQSGSALMNACYNTAPNAIKFFDALDCRKDNTEDTVSCLRQKDMEVLDEKINDPGFASSLQEIKFMPVLDGEFVKLNPEELLQDPTRAELEFFSSLDYMSGFTDMEGAFLAVALYAPMYNITDLGNFNISRKDFEETFLPQIVKDSFPGRTIPAAVMDAFVYQYTDWSDPNNHETTRLGLVEVSGDHVFVIPAIKTADLHASLGRSQNRYLYEFAVKPSMDIIWPLPSWIKGSSHGMDIPFVFGLSEEMMTLMNVTDRPQPYEYDIAQYMMDYWTNFAQTGNPNEPRKNSAVWPKYTKENREYLKPVPELTSDAVKSRVAEPRTAFWLNLIPSLMECGPIEEVQLEINESKDLGKDEL